MALTSAIIQPILWLYRSGDEPVVFTAWKRMIVALVAAGVMFAGSSMSARGSDPFSEQRPATDAQTSDVLKQQLVSQGIKPDAEGLRVYFDLLDPAGDQGKKVAALIKNLDADDYGLREQATKDLALLQVTPAIPLMQAAKCPDVEVAWRATMVLRRLRDEGNTTCFAVLELIERERIQGFAKQVLAVLPFCSEMGDDSAGIGALVATALPGDLPLLREALANRHVATRLASAKAVAALRPGKAVDLRPLLADPDQEVRWVASRALTDAGDKSALPVLIDLLNSEDPNLRDEAAHVLRSVADQTFNQDDAEDGGDDPQTLAKTFAAWKAWHAKEASGLTLRLPVPPFPSVQLFNGKDLTGWEPTFHNRIFLDPIMWSAKSGAILHCNGGLPNGNGQLRTLKRYKDYILTLEWRMPAETGDSGVFLFVDEDPAKVGPWLEVQLLRKHAGELVAIGGFNTLRPAKGRFAKEFGRTFQETNEKPTGEWNQLEIRNVRGKVAVRVNGLLQNECEGCPETPHRIALQVMNQVVEFRNIRLQRPPR